jgi:photosystem II stability/assembly factor-like uncharacterized protein
MFAPSFSPHNSGELFASCDMSELFHTTNLGATWTTTPFQNIQGGRLSLVQFTNNPQILYTLDHTSIDGGDTRTPVRSGDGGVTWSPLGSDPTASEAYCLFADLADSDRSLVSDYSTLYFSDNGGDSFAEKHSAGSAGNGLFVSGVFFDGANIYVGTNAGMLVSDNSGGSFTLSSTPGIPVGKEIVSFAGAKQSGTTRLFALVADAGTIYPGILIEDLFGSEQSVYVLDVSLGLWVPKNNGLPSGTGVGLAFVGCAQNNIGTAYVSGQNANEEPVIYKTTNGGDSWQSVLSVGNTQNVYTGWEGYQGDRGWSYGGGTVGFTVAPNDANRAAFTDYGFLHLTTDGGATWRQAYLHPADQNPPGQPTPKGKEYRGVGLENTSCWWLTWSDMSHIFACFTDIRGIRTEDAGTSWSFNYTGHTQNTAYHCVKDPTSETLYLATSTVHDLYQSTYLTDTRIDSGSGRVLFSTDQGITWQLLHDFGHPVIWLALDSNHPNRLYASVVHSSLGGIYVSDDLQHGAASIWVRKATPVRTEGHPFNVHVLANGMLVCTYSGRRNNNSFTSSSGVFTSIDGGDHWNDASDPGMHYWTKDLVIDPHDPSQDTWYVGVFSGWGGPPNGLGGLYKTANRGQSWNRILNLDRVASCTIHPGNPGEMYVTTEAEGLWHTTNLNGAAPFFAQVDSYPFRQPERVFFNPFDANQVWVTSFGNGIRIGDSSPPSNVSGWRLH